MKVAYLGSVAYIWTVAMPTFGHACRRSLCGIIFFPLQGFEKGFCGVTQTTAALHKQTF